jgi:hypothetical protein
MKPADARTQQEKVVGLNCGLTPGSGDVGVQASGEIT